MGTSKKDRIKRKFSLKGYLTNEEANRKEAFLINQEKKQQSFEIQKKTRKSENKNIQESVTLILKISYRVSTT